MHQRSDRDKYVKINWENIKESDKFNFDKLDDALFFDVPYDAKSMMHYPTIGHTSKNGKATIESLVIIEKILWINLNYNQKLICRWLMSRILKLERLTNSEPVIFCWSENCMDAVSDHKVFAKFLLNTLLAHFI